MGVVTCERISVLVLIVALGGIAGGAPSETPHDEFQEFSGTIRCGARSGNLDAPFCNGDEAGDTSIAFEAGAGLSGYAVEVAWNMSSDGADRLFVSAVNPFPTGEADGGLQAEGVSPVRLETHAANESAWVREATTLNVSVGPPRSGASNVVSVEQPFRLTVHSFHYGFLPGVPVAPIGEDSPGPDPDAAASSPPATAVVPLLATAGAVLAVAGFSWVLRPRIAEWLSVPFAGLFTRLRRSTVLDHPRRRELMTLVEQNPGIAMAEAQARLAMRSGAFTHHLRILEAHALVTRQESAGRIFLRPSGVASPPVETSLELRLLRLVEDHPGQRQVDLCAALGLPETTVRYHILKLARRGRLRLVEEGRAVRCFPMATQTDTAAPARSR